jgi:hypothetical protein
MIGINPAIIAILASILDLAIPQMIFPDRLTDDRQRLPAAYPDAEPYYGD